jgi:hypothetical protein
VFEEQALSERVANAIVVSDDDPFFEGMSVNRKLAAAIVVVWLACSACAAAESPTVASVEASDTIEGAMLRAIRAAEPELHARIVATAQEALSAGKTTVQAVASARSDYYTALLKRLKWSPDRDALDERDASLRRLEYLLAHDPIACAKASAGDSSGAATALPDDMLRSEMERVTRAMAIDTSGPPLAVLSREEMERFINGKLEEHPERFPALRLLLQFRTAGPETAYISREDAISVCDVNIKTMRDSLALPLDMQPKYQRAMVSPL